MPDKSLRAGKCPKCGSAEIYTDKDYTKSSERMTIPVIAWKRIFFDIYVCTNCGYFEEFIADKDIKDDDVITKIKKNWKKVK